MCKADLTIEVKDKDSGGDFWFGAEHECVKWEQLLGSVSEWETFGQSRGSK